MKLVELESVNDVARKALQPNSSPLDPALHVRCSAIQSLLPFANYSMRRDLLTISS